MDVDYPEFLLWAYPTATGNLVRGHLAEYLVARALSCLEPARDEWAPHDLLWDGVRIEVKATSTLQTWQSERPSPPSFGVGAVGRSDLHVFAWHSDVTLSPTDSGAWTFFVLPTPELAGRRSIRLSVLRGLAQPSDWDGLRAAAERARSAALPEASAVSG